MRFTLRFVSDPSYLDRIAEEFDRDFQASDRVEDAKVPSRRLPPNTIVAVLFPDDPSPKDRICAFGPCVHYATQVIHLPTANEDANADGIAHAERTHYCFEFHRDIGGETIFDCSRWVPEKRTIECDGTVLGDLTSPTKYRCNKCRCVLTAGMPDTHTTYAKPIGKQAYIDSIRAKPTDVQGWSKCSVCGMQRESSGVLDLPARHAASPSPAVFCWCGEKDADAMKTTTEWSEP